MPASLRASAGGCAVALANVRGPPVALTICGRPVKRVVPFLPPPPGVAVGAALSTVGGQATLCFNCADGTHGRLRARRRGRRALGAAAGGGWGVTD